MALDSDLTHPGVLTVLGLLASEAPASAYEEFLASARQSDISPDHLDQVQDALRLALTVRTQLGRRQQREAGLSALVDTARDLNLPYDLDSLLKIITRRARLLLNLDMAYISFLEEAGVDSYVRTADGHASALTVGFRVPGGSGLGSAASASAAPFWTHNYLADSRVRHHEVIDEVVRAEGLHAIVAIPLRHRDVSFGVLYGADRNIRHFTPEEVSLLSSLADLATVAIEKARMLSRVREDIAELEQYSSRAKSDLASVRRISEGHQRMLDLLLEGADLTALTALAAELLGGTLAVLDSEGLVLTSSGDLPEIDQRSTTGAALEAHLAREPLPLDGDSWLAPVSAGPERLGSVLLHRAEPLSQDELRLLQLAAGATAVLTLMRRDTAVAESQVREEFFEALLSTPHRPLPQLRDRARKLGVDLSSPYGILVVQPEGGPQGRAVIWASSFALRYRGLSNVRGGCITMLLPGADPGQAARRITQELSPLLGHPVTVGAAGPASSIEEVEPTYREAVRCLNALTALGGSGTAASSRELGFLGLLLGDHHSVETYVTDTLGPVIAYDSHRFTNLVVTLEAYFASGSSPTYAAESLHVHPNTVSRRLERITALLGDDWQEPARALEVQLALRLHRTRDSLRSTEGAEGAGS